jgi:hypothetical protein
MALPPTLLSLIYHGTIPLHREHMHAHPTQTFDRYRIAGAAVQKACLDVDAAAFDLRSNPNSPAAQTKLEATSQVLFKELEPLLAGEIANGVVDSSQPILGTPGSQSSGLLSELYRLLYSKDFRSGNPGLASPPSPLPGYAQAEKDAWEAVKTAVSAGAADPAKARRWAEVLCLRLKADFDQEIWTYIW